MATEAFTCEVNGEIFFTSDRASDNLPADFQERFLIYE